MERAITALGWMIAIATGVGALAYFVALFVIAVSLVPQGHEGDLGTWAGAVFAGLAFAGTIWIATSEARERRRVERMRALIVLPALHGTAGLISAGLAGILSSVKNWKESENKSQETWELFVDECIEILERMPPLAPDELQHFVAISHRNVGQLNAIQAALQTALSHQRLVINSDEARWLEDVDFLERIASRCFRACTSVMSDLLKHQENHIKSIG